MDYRLDAYLDKQDRDYEEYYQTFRCNCSLEKETKMTTDKRPSDNISDLLIKFLLWRISICGLNKPEELKKDPLGAAILAETERRGIPFTEGKGNTMTMGDEINMLIEEFNTFVLEQALTDKCYPSYKSNIRPSLYFHADWTKHISIGETPGAVAEMEESEQSLIRLRNFNKEHGI